MSLIRADFHVHTTLSDCASREHTPDRVLQEARETGLEALGISDHIFGPDDLRKPKELRAQLPERLGNLRIYVGCEAEMHGPTEPTIDADYAAQVDFVIMATSHLYYLGDEVLNGLGEQELLGLMLDLMDGAIETGCGDIIAHPFRVNGCRFGFADLVAALDRDRLMQTARKAARAGIAMECNPAFLRAAPDAAQWLFRSFLETGCKLSIGSDSHYPGGIGCHGPDFATEDELRTMGLSEGTLWVIEDRVTARRRHR